MLSFNYGEGTDLSLCDAVKVPSSFLISQGQSDMDFVSGSAITDLVPSFATESDRKVITTVVAAVQFSTRTGSGYGLEVDQVKAVAKAVEDGYLASTTSTFTIILGAVPIENDTAIVPIAQFVNVKLP